MSRSCSICLNPRVQDVDSLLAAGRSARSVAAELGLPPESLKRHARHRVKSTDARPQATIGTDPLDELTAALRDRALGSQNAAFAREYRLAIAAQAERSAERPAYDVLADPQWLRLRALLVAALERFPEARAAVANALREELS